MQPGDPFMKTNVVAPATWWKLGPPKRLRDMNLEFNTLVCSRTYLDIDELNGEVPETKTKWKVPLQTSATYANLHGLNGRCTGMDLVVTSNYPDQNVVLGRCWGPSTDFGSHLTKSRWVLIEKGEILNCATVRQLNPDEESSPEHWAWQQCFTTAIHDKLGPLCDLDVLQTMNLPQSGRSMMMMTTHLLLTWSTSARMVLRGLLTLTPSLLLKPMTNTPTMSTLLSPAVASLPGEEW